MRTQDPYLLVTLREDNRRHAAAPRRDGLLLDTSDGHHDARQRHLPRHRQVGAHGLSRGERYHRRDHGATGGGTILGRRSRWHVHVKRRLIEEGVVGLLLVQVGPGEGVRDVGGLLHHVAQLSRGLEGAPLLVLPVLHDGGALDVQRASARRVGVGRPINSRRVWFARPINSRRVWFARIRSHRKRRRRITEVEV